eukprot:GHVU01067211.1.p1 GENE.GHVU01067211.1~~GHVU01067211.1.p1  ORF type:complete len:381 (+),score=18.59 GHVU01067211.1:2487-3629(+)
MEAMTNTYKDRPQEDDAHEATLTQRTQKEPFHYAVPYVSRYNQQTHYKVWLAKDNSKVSDDHDDILVMSDEATDYSVLLDKDNDEDNDETVHEGQMDLSGIRGMFFGIIGYSGMFQFKEQEYHFELQIPQSPAHIGAICRADVKIDYDTSQLTVISYYVSRRELGVISPTSFDITGNVAAFNIRDARKHSHGKLLQIELLRYSPDRSFSTRHWLAFPYFFPPSDVKRRILDTQEVGEIQAALMHPRRGEPGLRVKAETVYYSDFSINLGCWTPLGGKEQKMSSRELKSESCAFSLDLHPPCLVQDSISVTPPSSLKSSYYRSSHRSNIIGLKIINYDELTVKGPGIQIFMASCSSSAGRRNAMGTTHMSNTRYPFTETST